MTQTHSQMRIDSHCHLGPQLLAEELLALMDASGVERAVVFPDPIAWTLPHAGNYYNTNDYIADAQARYRDRLIGFGCVNPSYMGNPALGIASIAAGEVERCILQLGLHGMQLHPEVHCFTIDSLCRGQMFSAVIEALVRLQAETGRHLPLIAHGMTTIGAQVDQFAKLAADYPDISIIIAHGAGFQNLYFPSKSPITQHANLYVDTAMATVDDSDMRNVARTIGIEKILFGTNLSRRDQLHLYGNYRYILERTFPDPRDREQLFGGNIARLLGLSDGQPGDRATAGKRDAL